MLLSQNGQFDRVAKPGVETSTPRVSLAVAGGLMQHYATYGILFDGELNFNSNFGSPLAESIYLCLELISVRPKFAISTTGYPLKSLCP
jgi:hypothetical protein